MSSHIIRYITATLHVHSMPYPKDQLKLLPPKEKKNANTMCQGNIHVTPLKLPVYYMLPSLMTSCQNLGVPLPGPNTSPNTPPKTRPRHCTGQLSIYTLKVRSRIRVFKLVPQSFLLHQMLVTLESSLTLQCPWTITLKKVCQSSFFQIRNLSSIRKMLPKSTAEILVHAFITSRLDNRNALWNGISEQQIHKLQIVQNLSSLCLNKHSQIRPHYACSKGTSLVAHTRKDTIQNCPSNLESA